MSLFKLPNAGRNAHVSDNHTVRPQSKPKLGRTFMDSARKIAKQASRLFKATDNTQTRATQTVLSPKTDQTNNPGRTNHTMLEVRFASSQRTARQASFPYRVEHRFTGSVRASQNAPGINALLPELSKSIQNKQGFVYLHDNTSASPMAKFVADFENQDSIDIGNGCRIVGAFRTPAETASVYSPQWTFQVYDASIEATFEVPVTEVPLKGLNNPANTTAQLLHLKNCMDSHLKALPDAFKDSPSCPAIICPQHPRLAQLVTAQEECLGRQYRGELHCQDGMGWILAAEDTLKTISPESPSFVGEESVDFESFFNRSGLHAYSNNRLPFSIALAGDRADDPNNIRAFKRHIPHTREPRRQTTATPVATAVPLATAAPAAASVPRANALPPATTVPAAVAAPAARAVPALNWLEQRNRGIAYKEPQADMQCGTQSINCLLQGHVLSSEKMARLTAIRKLDYIRSVDGNPNEQVGLLHPRVLGALQAEQPVTISRAEFEGPEPGEACIAFDNSYADTWREMINHQAIPRGLSRDENEAELEAINEITIDADTWLAVSRGSEMTDLLSITNELLRENSSKRHLPRSMTEVNIAEQPSLANHLEALARNSIQRNKDFPMIVRTGDIGGSGHYFTIVPDAHGNWLSLNATGTSYGGPQHCERFCNAGGLEAAFLRAGVTNALIPNSYNS